MISAALAFLSLFSGLIVSNPCGLGFDVEVSGGLRLFQFCNREARSYTPNLPKYIFPRNNEIGLKEGIFAFSETFQNLLPKKHGVALIKPYKAITILARSDGQGIEIGSRFSTFNVRAGLRQKLSLFFGVNNKGAIHFYVVCNRAAGVYDGHIQHNRRIHDVDLSGLNLQVGTELVSRRCKRDFVASASFIKSGFDQPDTDRAQTHPDQGGNTHNLRPPRSDFLRSQVLFFAFIFALGLASLSYTIWTSDRRTADPFYTIFGVLAVYLGALGCLIF